jgi:hypothetical protein
MGEKTRKQAGKYLPLVREGRVRLYLPLERYGNIEQLIASGYKEDDETRHLMAIASIIKEAKERRAESEEKRRKFITESLKDFHREPGTINIPRPYCLGRVNHNRPSTMGK